VGGGGKEGQGRGGNKPSWLHPTVAKGFWRLGKHVKNKIAFLLNTLMKPQNEYNNLGLKELTKTDIILRSPNKLILIYVLWKGLSVFHVAVIILFCFKIPPFDGTFLVTLKPIFK